MAGSVWSLKHKCPLITLIIRAKKNCVAYFEAEKVTERKQGRPAIYGEKVKLMELFDHKDEFAKMQCSVYGKVEEVLITSVDLLWKPTGTLIRFVLAVTSRGPIVLMCSDLSQEPVAALQLYCARVRIETMFDMLKNLIGAFRYRFWSKRLARHSRKPRKNEMLRKPSQKRIESVRRCHDAYERFVMLGAVALGLLQLIALKFQGTIWNHFEGFLRTRSRQLPSERTVKAVVTNLLVMNLIDSAPDAIIREIQERYDCKQTVFQRAVSSSE